MKLDEIVKEINTIPQEDRDKLKEIFADGKVTPEERQQLVQFGFRNWKQIVIILGLVIGVAWISFPARTPVKSEIEVDSEIRVKIGVLNKTPIKSDFKLQYLVFPKDREAEVDIDDNWIRVLPKSQGDIWVVLAGVNKDTLSQKVVTVRAGDPAPPPADPILSALQSLEKKFTALDKRITALEKPSPTPPGPGPAPPIPEKGLRVIIIEDKMNLSKLPEEQLEIRTSPTFHDFLKANCTEEANGHKAYRIWDFKTKAVSDLKVWQDALARPRTSLPWIIISNGVTGFEGPLPENEQKTIELISRYKS